MLKRLACWCLLVMAPFAGQATTGCEGIADQLRGPASTADVDFGDTLACKVMPGDEQKIVVVTQKNVLLLDSTSGRILSEGSWPNMSSRYTFAAIDMAPYWVTQTRRAIGVRFAGVHHQYALGVGDELLNLYLVEGSQLRLVLDGFVVRLRESDKDCEDAPEIDSACSMRMSEFKRTLAVGRTSHYGYADLLVNEAKKNDCKKSVNHCAGFETAPFGKAKPAGSLRFDGQHYVIPQALEQNPKWE